MLRPLLGPRAERLLGALRDWSPGREEFSRSLVTAHADPPLHCGLRAAARFSLAAPGHRSLGLTMRGETYVGLRLRRGTRPAGLLPPLFDGYGFPKFVFQGSPRRCFRRFCGRLPGMLVRRLNRPRVIAVTIFLQPLMPDRILEGERRAYPGRRGDRNSKKCFFFFFAG